MKVECIDCAALPPEPYYADGTPDGYRRPAKPRPIDPRSGPRSPRCATHYRRKLARERAARSAAHVRRTKGLTPEEYDALYEAQGRKCAIPRCRATGKVKRLAVDHDRDMAVNVCGHDRDQGCRNCARGLVCMPHNFELLGKYANDLADALAYIADPPARRILKGGPT